MAEVVVVVVGQKRKREDDDDDDDDAIEVDTDIVKQQTRTVALCHRCTVMPEYETECFQRHYTEHAKSVLVGILDGGDIQLPSVVSSLISEHLDTAALEYKFDPVETEYDDLWSEPSNDILLRDAPSAIRLASTACDCSLCRNPKSGIAQRWRENRLGLIGFDLNGAMASPSGTFSLCAVCSDQFEYDDDDDCGDVCPPDQNEGPSWRLHRAPGMGVQCWTVNLFNTRILPAMMSALPWNFPPKARRLLYELLNNVHVQGENLALVSSECQCCPKTNPHFQCGDKWYN